MGTPGLGYSLYLFDGLRGKHQTGLNKPLNGFGIKLYDSRNMPDPPIIKDPIHSIEENTAGTVSFTLLSGATGEIMRNGSGYTGEIQTSIDYIHKYVCYRQSEIVLCRSAITENRTIVEEEIWAGRVYSIKKDYYDNWDVTAEGVLAYLNDFSIDEETKWEQGTSAAFLIGKILGKPTEPGLYNKAVNDNIVKVGGSWRLVHPSSIESGFAHIDTRLFVGTVSDQLEWKASSYVSNSDNTFSLTEGTKYSAALNALQARFGGCFEIVYAYDQSNGDAKGRSIKYINWRQNKSFKDSPVTQKIRFGVNLLDYKEELEDTDFFTALYPIGSTQKEETETDEEGKTTKKTVRDKITIEGTSVTQMHPISSSKYIYKQDVVDEYGFIEKKEKWEIGDKEKLRDIAEKYYKDLSVGEPTITINAFDLKNLITTDISKDEYYAIDSLYLYDKIRIAGGGNQYYSGDIPIVGIKIPLSKFPTDTEYTMTNKTQRKSGLAPSNIPGVKPEETLPDADPTKPDDEKPVKEDPIKYLPPVGGQLGIDNFMTHYPPINIRRAASRWECNSVSIHPIKKDSSNNSYYIVFHNGERWVDAKAHSSTEIPEATRRAGKWARLEWVTDPSTGTRHKETKYAIWDWSQPSYIPKSPASGWGYKEGSSSIQAYQAIGNDMTLRNAFTDSSSKKPFSFYSDDMSGVRNPITRTKNTESWSEEKNNDYFEKATTYPRITPSELNTSKNPVNSYTNAYVSYYEHTEANAVPTQAWRSHFNLSKEQTNVTYKDFVLRYINKDMETGMSKHAYTVAATEALLNQIDCFGGLKLGAILSEIGMSLELNEDNNYIEASMTYHPEGGSATTIKRKLRSYFKDGDLEERNIGLIAALTNPSDDTTIIYYSMMNGTDPLPITTTSTYDNTINSAIAYTETIKQTEEADERIAELIAPIVTSLLGSIYDVTTDAGSSAYATAKATVSALLGGGSLSTLVELNGGSTTYEYNDVTIDLTSLAPDGSDTIPNGNAAMFHVLHGGTGAKQPYSSRKAFDDLIAPSVKAKLFQSMKPILIVTKAKNIGKGQTGQSYGAIFMGIGLTSGLSLTKTNDVYELTGGSGIGSSYMNTNGLMVCKDTLQNDGFLFRTIGENVSITQNGTIVPLIDSYNRSSTSPILVLTHHGGTHTGYISEGTYLYLCGDTSFAESSKSWKTTMPAYLDGEPMRYPDGSEGLRAETNDTCWYYNGGRDRPDAVDLPKNEEETYKWFEDTSEYQPIVVGTDMFVKVGQVYIKFTPKSEGSDS